MWSSTASLGSRNFPLMLYYIFTLNDKLYGMESFSHCSSILCVIAHYSSSLFFLYNLCEYYFCHKIFLSKYNKVSSVWLVLFSTCPLEAWCEYLVFVLVLGIANIIHQILWSLFSISLTFPLYSYLINLYSILLRAMLNVDSIKHSYV